jgi:hypothetical protein
VAAIKVKGKHTPRLSLGGANGSSVNIYRNSSFRTNGPNDGSHTDVTTSKGGGTYIYQICEAGGNVVCSSEVSVRF